MHCEACLQHIPDLVACCGARRCLRCDRQHWSDHHPGCARVMLSNPHRTGRLCNLSGVYRSDCSCATEAVVNPGQAFPHCHNCIAFVNWLLVKTVA